MPPFEWVPLEPSGASHPARHVPRSVVTSLLLDKEEKAKKCGYYTVTKNGVERVNMMKFLNALIDAEGIELDSTSNGQGRGGRSASYRISVQSNGNLLIGSAYTKKMGLKQGDEFEITLGRKHIHLRQIGDDDE